MYYILMVDDEADIDILTLQKFRHEIKDGTYQFYFARNGAQALEIIKKESNISIVITDINMPQMNGFELLSKLQHLPLKPKTMIVSAYGDSDSINRIQESGASGFINKPIDYIELKKLISMLVTDSHSNPSDVFKVY